MPVENHEIEKYFSYNGKVLDEIRKEHEKGL